MKRQICIIRRWLAWAFCLLAFPVLAQTEASPVTSQHLQIINAAFAREGVTLGRAEFDAYGRVELKGDYADEPEVDRAFSLAQVVVGPRWVSPVTPENIRVKSWEKKLGNLFLRANVLKPPMRDDGAAPGPIRNRYALVVGVGRFRYGISPLEFSARDAFSFYQFLTDPRRGQFRPENVIFYTDENATRANVALALDKLRQIAGEDDLVTVFISSHGTQPDKFGGVHVVLHDTETSPPEKVWHTSVNEEMLKNFVSGLRARRLVMVLDACYSNGAYRAVPGFLPPGGKSLGAGDNEGYGVNKEYTKRVIGGSKDLVFENETPRNAQAKSVGSASAEPYGKVLIGASSSNEQSWESNELHSGIFTYYFVDGLNRYGGSVQQAFDYARPRVASHAGREWAHKGASQHPTALTTVQNWDMRLMQSATR